MKSSVFSQICYIATDIFYAFTINIFFKNWFGTNPKLQRIFLFFSAYIFADCYIYFTQSNTLFFIVSAFFLFLFAGIAYSKNILRNLIGSSILLVLSMLCECITLGLTSFTQIIIKTTDETFFTISIFVLCKVIFFIEILICTQLFKNKNVYPFMPKKNVGIIIIPTISIWLIIYTAFISNYSKHYVNVTPDVPTLITDILILLINIITYYMYDKQAESYAIKLENSALSNAITTQTVQYKKELEHIDTVSQIRHDMKNYLISIKSQLDNNAYNEAADSISNMLNIINATTPVSHTGYYILDSLINYKCSEASQYGITIDYKNNLSLIPKIADSDLCILLGVAFDNAIEHLVSNDIIEKIIRINVVSNNTGFMFKMENKVTSAPTIIDGKIIASTKNNSEHGYGLKAANSIAEKYGGEVILQCENNIFSFSAIVH